MGTKIDVKMATLQLSIAISIIKKKKKKIYFKKILTEVFHTPRLKKKINK